MRGAKVGEAPARAGCTVPGCRHRRARMSGVDGGPILRAKPDDVYPVKQLPCQAGDVRTQDCAPV